MSNLSDFKLVISANNDITPGNVAAANGTKVI